MNIETNRIEYKEKLTDSLEKEAVAFLNSKGGDIYIGVKNDGTAVGVANPDDIQLKIKDRLKDNIRPSILGLFDVFTKDMHGKTVVVVNIASGSDVPYYIKQKGRSESGCFIRIGSAIQPMPEEMIAKLMAKRHPISLRNLPSSVQDLKFAQLKIYYAEKGKELNEHFATNLKFRTPYGKYNQIAYLFADENRFSIRFALWSGKDRTSKTFKKEEYGDRCLLTALSRIQDRMDVANQTQSKKQGFKPRLDKKYVDKEALREAVINAFVHNDYSRDDTPIFEVFEDRFEITTYGNPLEYMTEEAFFTGCSTPRNPEIMRIFQDLELVEHLGTGIPYIVGLYGREAFQISKVGVRLTLKFDKSIEEEAEREAALKSKEESSEKSREKTTIKTTHKTTIKTTHKIIEVIRQNPKVTTLELSGLLDLTIDGIKWNLKKLKEENKIRRVGSKKDGYWEII
ncbi:MAG: putative DNA binding domain-containing protein [Endomicrobia bacterium]|nr:putative DNA binding domain-containing protein [Endomicrobiia bacterium]